MRVSIPEDAIDIDKMIDRFYLVVFLWRESGKVPIERQLSYSIVGPCDKLAFLRESTIFFHEIVVGSFGFLINVIKADCWDFLSSRSVLILVGANDVCVGELCRM